MAGAERLCPASEAVDDAAEVPAAAGMCNEQSRFLCLPRELRDKIYNHTFGLEDARSERALRIERRNLKYFCPSASAILLVLHHEYFLLSRQIAEEALEVLLKHHTVFLSCGPYVLKALLERIEQHHGQGRQWLRWMKNIELDWVTFPNLRTYPPDRENGRDEWYWEHSEEGDAVDDVRGAQYNRHYDESDHDGAHYDDNFYDPSNLSLYPSFYPPTDLEASSTDDPFGLAHHYPFNDPSESPEDFSAEDIATKLDLLVSMEVTPLFTYLASPAFNLNSVTLPLYFISKESHHLRGATRPGYTLPLKIRFWVHVCVHALLMLKAPSSSTNPPLQEVRVKYLPWDIWASMNPADDLHRMVAQGIWFDESDDEDGDGNTFERDGEGEAFRAIWAELAAKEATAQPRFGLAADLRFVRWDGNVDSWRVGDELEVVFTKSKGNN